jgi:hypothetical protein
MSSREHFTVLNDSGQSAVHLAMKLDRTIANH